MGTAIKHSVPDRVKPFCLTPINLTNAATISRGENVQGHVIVTDTRTDEDRLPLWCDLSCCALPVRDSAVDALQMVSAPYSQGPL